MKYRNKTYKNFIIIFENGKPSTVILHFNDNSSDGYHRNEVTTYWDNKMLTEKPLIEMESELKLKQKGE